MSGKRSGSSSLGGCSRLDIGCCFGRSGFNFLLSGFNPLASGFTFIVLTIVTFFSVFLFPDDCILSVGPELVLSSPWDRLIEGSRLVEHRMHVFHIGDMPIPNGLVEGFRFLEHVTHVLHIGDIPMILVQRLVEGLCTVEH